MNIRSARVLAAIAVAGAAVALVVLVAQPGAPRATAQPRGWSAALVADGIPHPWGMTWLPDGRALVTSRSGTLHLLTDGRLDRVPMEGLPPVFSEGQGGLMDVTIHPDDSGEARIYMTLSTGTGSANRTVLVRGVFDGTRVGGIETLFEAQPAKDGDEHFGSRLLWLPDGTLLMSIGDGGNPPRRVGGMLAREQAQNRQSHLGSILRLTTDGRPAPDNPFAGEEGLPEIWTYGHRNVQGLAIDDSGRVWASEHGPYGGDEVNLIEAGGNYGWPLQSHGRDYRTRLAIGSTSVEGMTDPVHVWPPTHAPSGLAFYTGDDFPAWRGSLFSGGLASEDIRRLAVDRDGTAREEERLEIGSRVRGVSQGPDGVLYVLTDERNGRVLRIEPAAHEDSAE